MAEQRSRPVALLGRLRELLYGELAASELPPTLRQDQMHYNIDCDLRELDEIVAGCERLFSSPIPPNMARHGMRSLVLWLLLLPLFLAAGGTPTLPVALCAAGTAYIYFGIEELGVQVEQPFRVMPLWQLCHLVQFNIEESLASPELPLRIVRARDTADVEAERFDLFGEGEGEGEQGGGSGP